MAELILALGTNQGDRVGHLRRALEDIQPEMAPMEKSPIYLSEPLGPSQQNFLNAICILNTSLKPQQALEHLKRVEAQHGRDFNAPRWSARPLDLDIISYDDLVIQTDTLIIPHSEYRHRLFVLLPLRDLCPHWTDPQTGISIEAYIKQAPSMHIRRTPLTWQTS
ncbi:MAG: 2-amino-4-hydroxy-6-hydroxymethyldihydropteridine diphosphokinase [Bacteroidota bacterium]